jgi:hypothetical protein
MMRARRPVLLVLSGMFLAVSPLVSVSSLFAATKAPPAKSTQGKSAPAKKAAKKVDGKVLFNFETDLDGWRIPDWAFEKSDNAALEASVSPDFASAGKKSLKLSSKFPPKMWSGSYVEIEQESGSYMDFSPFPTLRVDVYLPAEAPKKMKGEIILTVGDAWAWTEMRQPIELTPGAWTILQANVLPDSTSWKSRLTPDLVSDVRKLGVRVSCNQGSYTGPVYIDNVRLESAPAQ